MATRVVRISDDKGVSPFVRRRFFAIDDEQAVQPDGLIGNLVLWTMTFGDQIPFQLLEWLDAPKTEAEILYMGGRGGPHWPPDAAALQRAAQKLFAILRMLNRTAHKWGWPLARNNILYQLSAEHLIQGMPQVVQQDAVKVLYLRKLWHVAEARARVLTDAETAYFGLQ